jgi:DNA-binding NtrC family response regulator
MIISRAIQSCLETLGFVSFDHTWTEAQAIHAASQRHPDLVVIGDDVETGSALGAAKQISSMLCVPVLMVTGDPFRARAQLAKTCAFEGPFLLNQIEEAVQLAQANTRPNFMDQSRSASLVPAFA